MAERAIEDEEDGTIHSAACNCLEESSEALMPFFVKYDQKSGYFQASDVPWNHIYSQLVEVFVLTMSESDDIYFVLVLVHVSRLYMFIAGSILSVSFW
ncbi:hypothetical protein C5167_026485 [Papaver somniferum]|nr:hypothetical protein C5167_026485 [Papaver somniferum]